MASVGSTRPVCFPWMLLVFILAYLCNFLVITEKLTFWLDPDVNEDIIQVDYNVERTTGRSWWDAAQSGCSQFGGNLYIPQSQSLTEDVIHSMEYFTHYWIGAMKYPVWIWTADQSNLYTYEGYLPLTKLRPNSRLEGNSVVTCHQSCSRETRLGLRGNDCYCLGNFLNGVQSGHSGVRCPGNYDEYCGDEYGISVYKQESTNVIPSSDSKCGFISVSKTRPNISNPYSGRTTYYPILALDDKCYTTRGSACEKNITRHIDGTRVTWTWTETFGRTRSAWTCSGNVCITNTYSTFNESNQKCDLIKVTLRDIEYLSQAMVRLFSTWNTHTYWIGLKRNSVKKWNNGSDMLLTVDDYFGVGAVLPTCLAVSKTYRNSARFHWIKCQNKLQSICEKVKVRTTKPPTRMSTHSTNTPTPPHIDPLSTSDVVHPSSIHRTTTKKSKLEGVADSERNSNNGNVGIYVGSSTGAVVILVAVILLLISYRKRLLCFKETPILAASQDVNAIYDANPTTGGSLQEHNVYETLPCASDRNSPYYSIIHVYNNTDPK